MPAEQPGRSVERAEPKEKGRGAQVQRRMRKGWGGFVAEKAGVYMCARGTSRLEHTQRRTRESSGAGMWGERERGGAIPNREEREDYTKRSKKEDKQNKYNTLSLID